MGCSNLNNAQHHAEYYHLPDFEKVKKIDAHVHIRTMDSTFAVIAKSNGFRLITIDTDELPGIAVQNRYALHQGRHFPQTVAHAATISLDRWDHETWAEETISSLQSSIDNGARAIKLYKNIGMELRNDKGGLVMINDPKFIPIINFLAANNIPIVGHFAEPKNCWLPIEEMTIKGDKVYFSRHPEFHMYLHPEMPSYEEQIRARYEMLRNHDDLKFIGAHLGSIEWDLDSLGKFLDDFPNASVDLAARLSHIQLHAKNNYTKTRDFFIKYQDKIIYGTDIIVDQDAVRSEVTDKVVNKWREDWAFLSGGESMTSNSFDGNFKGLKLPKKVIDKVYYTNAKKLFFDQI